MSAPTRTALIDRVDGLDSPVGRVARGQALCSGANFRTVHVFVLDAGGRLMIQRLAESRERYPGRWGSSVAAYLHAGEGYREAARRRLLEELGLRLALDRVGKLQMHDERSLKFVELYTARDGEPSIREPEHIAELEYRSLAELDRSVSAEPESFTPTFLRLYVFFRRRDR